MTSDPRDDVHRSMDLEATARGVVHHWMSTQKRLTFRLEGSEPIALANAIAQALTAVREADAQVAESMFDHRKHRDQYRAGEFTMDYVNAGDAIAAAIRQGGT